MALAAVESPQIPGARHGMGFGLVDDRRIRDS
jgi:hypothetical protein